jgi:hypothetical protein
MYNKSTVKVVSKWKLILYGGPPAAGKSTYVRENRSKNSLTFDFDVLMTAMSGLKPHQKNKNLIGYVLDFRKFIISKLEKEKRLDDVWIIITWVDEEVKEKFIDIENVNYILMDTDMETCLERVDNDPNRADVAEEMKQVIKDWFDKYVENNNNKSRNKNFYINRGSGERMAVKKLEQRMVETAFEVKAEGEEEKKIVGYAAVFDDPAPETWGFIEKITPGAFAEAIERSDTRALKNHNPDLLLGRTKAGTLTLEEDEKGLFYEIDPPDTTYANDLMESMNRGDLDQSSFQFTVEKEEWDESGDVPVRTILKVGELRDVSPVTFPWYPTTESGVRSRKEVLQEYREQKEDKEKQQRANEGSLNLYKAKIKINERKCK